MEIQKSDKVTVLVTGARGLLGATLLRSLPAEKFHIQGSAADVRTSSEVARDIATPPSWIIHTASITNVGYCEAHPREAYDVNVEGTKNMLALAKEHNARFLYISTMSVFDGATGGYRESDIPKPINVFNATKRAGEEHTLAYKKGAVLRLNLIGIHPDGSRGKNFLEWLTDSFKTDTDLSLFDDVMINPLTNWQAGRLLPSILEYKGQESIFHFGSREVLSKGEIGMRVAEHFPLYRGTISHTSVDQISDGVVRPKNTWLSTDYTEEKLGVRMPSLEEGLEELFKLPPYAS